MDRQRLLVRLGWTDRFRSRNAHVFPVDDTLYQPIGASVGELEDRLDQITQGYIGVFGTPGSGKSTLLTQALRFRPERIVRYYAFVPEAISPNIGRGESENFLHDLVLALHHEGFSAGDAPVGFERLALLERLHNQLQLLGKDWNINGNKTIILIDGLDHVSRDPRPSRSFLDDMPTPAMVPEGVVFILGSQTDTILPAHIRSTVRDERRRVQMQPLSQREILAVTERTDLSVPLSQGHKARLVDLSAGQPLALVYLLNALKQASGRDDVSAILDGTPAFTGDIAARYEAAWNEVASDHGVVKALGYAARLRGPVALDWLETWLGFEPLRTVRQYFGHFFRRESGDRAYFFHDSFRVFLAERTSETWSGQPDPQRDATLHRDLAERCSQEPRNLPLAWEEVYHRIQSGQDEVVTERATQEYFRNQVFALRPIAAIRADVNLALQAAGRMMNTVSFSRLVLAGAELEQRLWHLDQVPLVRLLLELGESHLAVEHVRLGSRLRTFPENAMEVVPDLIDAGLLTEAARIFDLAEPLDLLRSGGPIDDVPHGEARPLLIAWAEVATRYHPVVRVARIARTLTLAPTQWRRGSPEEETRALQNEVIFHAALGLIRERRWDDVTVMAGSLDPALESDARWWVWIHVHAWRKANGSDLERARSFFEAVTGQFGSSDLEPDERMVVATTAFHLVNDEALARQWVEDIPRPDIDILGFGGHGDFLPFEPLYAHTRIWYAIGGGAGDLAPPPVQTDTDDTGIERFQRLVQVVARIEGASWRGDLLSPDAVTAAIQPYLYLFDRRLSYQTMGSSWFGAARARARLVERLIRAVALHGGASSNALRMQLERSWDDIPWSSDDRRSAIVALSQVGAPATWAVAALRDLEATLFQGKLTIERIDDCWHQAEAWMDLGQYDYTRSMLQRLVLETNAIAFRKDHQLAIWIDQWLSEAIVTHPERAEELVRWFTNATLILEKTTEEGADTSAAESLICAAFRWSPRRAARLFIWFLEEEMVPFDDALVSLLHAALNTSHAPVPLISSLVAEVVIPVSMDGPPPKLLKRLLSMEMEQGDRAKAVDSARMFSTRAVTRALPSVRGDWSRALAQALEPLGIERTEVGLDRLFTDPSNGTQGPTPSPLKFRDGTERGPDAVVADAQSVSRIVELLDQEAPDSFFDWRPVIERVATLAPTDDLVELATAFQVQRGSERVQYRLGEIFLGRGEHSLAKEAFLSVLEMTQGLGWDRRWGGGENLDTARRLVELDRAWARPRTLGRLIAYLTDEPGRYGQIARNLHEIVVLLDDHPPIAEIWSEVEDFVCALFAAHDVPRGDFDWLSEPPANDGVNEGLADLVTMLLRHPALVIAQAAQRVCAIGILRADTAMRLVAKSGLQGSANIQLPVLQLMHAVSLGNPEALIPLRTSVVELTDSPDFAIRSIARAICADLGWEVRAVRRIARPISYTLELPLGPLHIVRPFEDHFAMLAGLTGLPEASITRRVTEIMDHVADPTSWSSTAESNLSAAIHNVRIHLPYRRPRVQVARSALFRVVAELVDAGDLDQQDLTRFNSWLRIHDPAMVLLNPAERPQWLPPMEESGYGQDVNSLWLSQIGQACGSQFAHLEGIELTPLAIQAEFRQTTQLYPREQRRISVEAVRRPQAGDTSRSGVGRVFGRALTEYSTLRMSSQAWPMVIENVERNAYDTQAPNWSALSPTLGQDMGWHLVQDELLPRWVDTNGDAMVWSVWWTDGIVNTGWAAPSNVVGEGWLVLASSSALAALGDRLGPLQCRAVYTRSLEPGEGQPALERTHEEVRRLPHG